MSVTKTNVKDMRIALLTNRPENEGIGVYSRELSNTLRKLTDVSLVDLTTSHLKTSIRLLNEFAYFCSQTISWNKIPRGLNLYHFASPGYHVLSKFLIKSPTVATIHDLSVLYKEASKHSLILKLTLINSINKSNGLICISKYTYETLNDYFGELPLVKVIPYGINKLQFRPRDKVSSRLSLGLPCDLKISLYVGDTGWRKNMETLFSTYRGLEMMYKKNILFLHVGGTKDEIQRLCNKWGITRLHHVASLEHSKIHQYYNASDVFLFPSKYEGFGLPPLEAMASGVPVISSESTSLPEVVGGGGVLLDPLDVDGFIQTTVKTLEEPSFAQQLSEAGIRRAEMFSWERAAIETYRFYSEILEVF